MHAVQSCQGGRIVAALCVCAPLRFGRVWLCSLVKVPVPRGAFESSTLSIRGGTQLLMWAGLKQLSSWCVQRLAITSADAMCVCSLQTVLCIASRKGCRTVTGDGLLHCSWGWSAYPLGACQGVPMHGKCMAACGSVHNIL